MEMKNSPCSFVTNTSFEENMEDNDTKDDSGEMKKLIWSTPALIPLGNMIDLAFKVVGGSGCTGVKPCGCPPCNPCPHGI